MIELAAEQIGTVTLRLPARCTLLAIWFLVSGARAVAAQGTPPPDPRAAQPERPTIATHAYVVAPGIFELEAGGQWAEEIGVPGLLKIGLTRRIQLDIAPGWLGSDQPPPRRAGFEDTTVGVKWHVADNVPVLDAFAFQPTVILPTGSAEAGTGSGVTGFSLLLISSRTIRGASVDINVGCTLSKSSSAVSGTPTLWAVAAGVPLGRRLVWDAEVFGFPGTSGPAGERPVVAFLTGPVVALSKWFVVDGGVTVSIEGFGKTAVYAGLTWNVGRLWTRSSAGSERRSPAKSASLASTSRRGSAPPVESSAFARRASRTTR